MKEVYCFRCGETFVSQGRKPQYCQECGQIFYYEEHNDHRLYYTTSEIDESRVEDTVINCPACNTPIEDLGEPKD